MKKAYIYLISFFALAAAFSLCYFVSYRSALNNFNKSAVENNNELMLYAKENSRDISDSDNTELIENEPTTRSLLEGEYSSDDTIQVDSTASDKITEDTVYVLEEYDLTKDDLSEKQIQIPDEFIGLDRSGLMYYASNYMSNASVEDLLNGLTSMEVVSYSGDRVVMRKTYQSSTEPYKFYLMVYDGLITVYYSDKVTVYEYTDIDIKNLPESEQKKLNSGYPVEDVETLYGILENYSS